MREIRRRTRVVGAFPDGKSALMLVAARLRHVAATKWGTKRYLQMNRFAEVRSIAFCWRPLIAEWIKDRDQSVIPVALCPDRIDKAGCGRRQGSR